jgi:enoyl-CoA hydratase
MNAGYGDLVVGQRGLVMTVTINRPPVNALTRTTYAEITRAFAQVSGREDVRVVVLTAVGSRTFSAGVDLNEVATDSLSAPIGQRLDKGLPIRDALRAIGDCAVPVICAVNGPALGAGFGLVSMCDIIVAADNATFGFTEINVGLLGGISHLTSMVGRYRARHLYLTGARVSASELMEWGVVSKVVPGPALMDAAMTLADELAAKSPLATRLAKEAMNRVEGLSAMEGYQIEQDYTYRLNAFDDAREARAAFAERRTPRWTLR